MRLALALGVSLSAALDTPVRHLTALTSSRPLPVRAHDPLTFHRARPSAQCQQCCAPGGDCSKAFKGTPGKCCGTIGGQAFCCPGITYRGASSGDAKCHSCGEAYRCFTGMTTRNVCGVTPGHHTHHSSEWMRVHAGERIRMHRYDEDRTSTGLMVLLAVAVVLAVLFCVRRQGDVEQVRLAPNEAMKSPIAEPVSCTQRRTAVPAELRGRGRTRHREANDGRATNEPNGSSVLGVWPWRLQQRHGGRRQRRDRLRRWHDGEQGARHGCAAARAAAHLATVPPRTSPPCPHLRVATAPFAAGHHREYHADGGYHRDDYSDGGGSSGFDGGGGDFAADS